MRRLYRNTQALTILSRQGALDSGQKHFYTGRPCQKGHIAERYVSTGACLECLHPRPTYVGTGQQLARIEVTLERAITGAELVELQRLLNGWANLKLREWDVNTRPTAPTSLPV